jgi:hypothetical protein
LAVVIAHTKNEKLKEKFMKAENDYFFEGTLIAAGWDRADNVNQTSLYTQEDEDILLDHQNGVNVLKPFLNKKVRVWGKVLAQENDVRRVQVKKIMGFSGDFTKKVEPIFNEYEELSQPAA